MFWRLFVCNVKKRYLSAVAFVPVVVIEHPEVVIQLHREFIRARSDVVQSFTYYGHREKLRIIGKEHFLERLQKDALQIARNTANEFKDLNLMVSGVMANTNVYDTNDSSSLKKCQKIFEEQVHWTKESGVDFIMIETISWFEEMKIALQVFKKENIIALQTLLYQEGVLLVMGLLLLRLAK